jgi:hypothetical protein
MFDAGRWFERVAYDPRKAELARKAARAAAQRAGEAVTEEETDWFMRRLRWDGQVSPAERALVDFLKREAPGLTHGLTAAV